MKIPFLVLVLLLFVGIANPLVYAQKPRDSFAGTWVMSKNDERIVFVISKLGQSYRVRVSIQAGEPDSHDAFSATRNKNKLISTNKSILTEVKANHLHVTNFYFEGADELDLQRVDQLSEFFGIWKASPSDKQFILLYRDIQCSTEEECRQKSEENCFEIQLTEAWNPTSPMHMPERRMETPCRKGNLLTTVPRSLSATSTLGSVDAVSIELLSGGKIRIDWKERNIMNRTYSRIGPSILPAGK